jgi:putative endonuclease
MAAEIIIATYIMSNRKHGTLYVGVTDDLFRRCHEHRHGLYEGFTKKYQLSKLVYFERYTDILRAMHREERLKKYMREQKIRLIEKINPDWKDLYSQLLHYSIEEEIAL